MAGDEIMTQEKKRQHLVAEVIRVHRHAQLVRDAPEGLAQLFLVGVGHDLWSRMGNSSMDSFTSSGSEPSCFLRR